MPSWTCGWAASSKRCVRAAAPRSSTIIVCAPQLELTPAHAHTHAQVFGNSLYEGEGPPSNGAGGSGGGNGGGGTPLAKQGSMVKMNSFFMDPAKQGSLQSAASFRTAMGERDGTSTPTGSERGGAGAPALGLVARRLASATGGAAPGSGRLASSVTAAQAQAQAQQQQQLEEQSTEVLAFNDPDDAPVVARPRAVLPT